MHLGIYSRYQSHEASYAALQLADWAVARGHDVSIFSDDKPQTRLHPTWDRVVQHAGPRGYTAWLENLDAVLWTHCPIAEQVTCANRRGLRTIVMPFWHELRSDDRKALRQAQFVVVPSRAAADLVGARWQLKRCWAALWDPGLPFTLKNDMQHPERIKLLLPLFDHYPRVIDAACPKLLQRLMEYIDCVDLTVPFTPAQLSAAGLRQLKAFSRSFPGRVTLLKSVPLQRRPLLYAQHDLTIWPTLAENIGLVGLTSIAMGTPVLAFNYPPLSEFLSVKNSVLVPCSGQPESLGRPRIAPDFAAFEQAASQLLHDRQYLGKLQQTVHHNLENRRNIFNDVWMRALEYGA